MVNGKEYILWDNDGVLVETEYWYFKANQKALAGVAVDLDHNSYMQIMIEGRSSFDMAKDKGLDEKTITSMRDERDSYYQEFLMTEDIEIDGVEDVLRKLKEDFRMAIVTSCRKTDFDLIHGNRPLVKYMEFVATREMYGQSKPYPEPYLYALDKFGANKEKTVIVEDSERGLKAAVAAGIDCIIVRNDFTASQNFTEARYIIDSLADLPELLKSY